MGENTASGADLLLRGGDGSPDAALSEAALDRAADDDQVFEFSNSGSGAMTVRVDGVDVVTALTDSDTLAALACAADEIAKWDGGAWACSPDGGPDTLGSLSCASGQIVRWNGAAWECSSDLDTLGSLLCASGQVAQWNGAAWVCANTGTDTLAGLDCGDEQIVHWDGGAWVCGQPALTHLTCSDSGSVASCAMACPQGEVVWAGGCEAGASPDALNVNTPTGGASGPTGWECEAWDPFATASVSGVLYCVAE